jgi:uncharacterized protein YkwD
MRFQKQILVAFVASTSIFLAAGTAGAGGRASSTGPLLSAINATRAAHGLAPVRIDLRLGRVARAHSADMLRRGYFDHRLFGARMRASGAVGPRFGEDLAWSPRASTSWIVSGWLASPRHRAILLHAGFRRIGIGLARGSFAGHGGATIVTADFAGF